ncbi:MAG: hypothetical protein V4787_08625 [Pseudomonadota bacterium]
MNRLFSAKPLVAIALAFGALGATSMAQARDNVHLTIAVGEPYGYQQPVPVYQQVQPVYQAAPVYYVNGYQRGYDRGYERGGPNGDADRDGIPNRFDRDSRFFDWRAAQRDARWGDADRDGVPNRYDRAPYNPHRR